MEENSLIKEVMEENSLIKEVMEENSLIKFSVESNEQESEKERKPGQAALLEKATLEQKEEQQTKMGVEEETMKQEASTSQEGGNVEGPGPEMPDEGNGLEIPEEEETPSVSGDKPPPTWIPQDGEGWPTPDRAKGERNPTAMLQAVFDDHPNKEGQDSGVPQTELSITEIPEAEKIPSVSGDGTWTPQSRASFVLNSATWATTSDKVDQVKNRKRS
ncbi:hypothetical protein JRQ81_012381 [Phrynocephalus forsythii]|uniref:Uncharacterized protein n=1 Tax=Phrynocephalus forsythii TaxID=171643 RepID=A0A9Q0X5R9_9SAUR|nr:hypothetical protein JRQ81_012381 [Phrynocephalus forsythii]